MKRSPLVLFPVLALLFLASCGQQPVKGSESSISGTNDITRLKITANQVGVRSGCSSNANVLQTLNKDSKLDVIGKVADWYAVKLPNNDIGFVPQKQSTPVVPDEIKPGTAADTKTAPNTAPGTAQGTKQNTPDATKTNTSALTAQEQEMFNLVNQARAQANVPALQVDMEVTKVARIKSQDMIDNNYFSHNSPKYGSPFDMMKSFGINYVHAGENIAGNQTVQAAHNALMNSPGHRKNILSTDYTHIGIGIQKGGQYGNMFTQDFISKPT
jgi:uncharacterized YkwD family protein